MAPKWLRKGHLEAPGASFGPLGASWYAVARLWAFDFVWGGLPTRHYSRIPRLFNNFWVILGLLLGVVSDVFCCFATSRSGPPVGGQKGPWAATFSGKNRDRGGERTVIFLLLAGLGEMVFTPVFPWSLLLAFRCAGVASKIAKNRFHWRVVEIRMCGLSPRKEKRRRCVQEMGEIRSHTAVEKSLQICSTKCGKE